RVFTIHRYRVVGEKGELALYETATGKRLRAFSSEESYPLAVSPSGALAVWTGRVKPAKEIEQQLGYWDEKVVVRRLDTGRDLFQIATGGDYPNEVVEQAIFSPDSRLIAVHSHWLAESFTRSAYLPTHRVVEVVSGKDIVTRSSSDYPW